MIDSVTEMGSGRTTSDSCEVERFGTICCQDFIVVWKGRSELLEVSHNQIMGREQCYKKADWKGETEQPLLETRTGGQKQIMCSGLQSTELKKSETTKVMSVF